MQQSTTKNEVKRNEGDRNREHDDGGAERPDFRRDDDVEGFTARVSCRSSIERPIKLPSASHTHSDEQEKPIDEGEASHHRPGHENLQMRLFVSGDGSCRPACQGRSSCGTTRSEQVPQADELWVK